MPETSGYDTQHVRDFCEKVLEWMGAAKNQMQTSEKQVDGMAIDIGKLKDALNRAIIDLERLIATTTDAERGHTSQDLDKLRDDFERQIAAISERIDQVSKDLGTFKLQVIGGSGAATIIINLLRELLL